MVSGVSVRCSSVRCHTLSDLVPVGNTVRRSNPMRDTPPPPFFYKRKIANQQ